MAESIYCRFLCFGVVARGILVAYLSISKSRKICISKKYTWTLNQLQPLTSVILIQSLIFELWIVNFNFISTIQIIVSGHATVQQNLLKGVFGFSRRIHHIPFGYTQCNTWLRAAESTREWKCNIPYKVMICDLVFKKVVAENL